MQLYTCVLVLVFLMFASSSAIPKPDGEKAHKDRSKATRLSDELHEKSGGEHNPDYDHEAFLGEQESKTFDQLSPEESQEKLGIIVDKMDKNKDGLITEIELKEWIQYVQTRYIVSDTARMWKDHDVDGDLLAWSSYKKRTYGYDDEPEPGSPNYEYRDMIGRDNRRWNKADVNGDGKLTKEEFGCFLHPEDAEHMRDIVVLETLEDIDKDKDGFISLEEYIADIWSVDDEDADEDADEDDHHKGEPDWVASEREQFTNVRDKDKNGKLDAEEIKEWIIPTDYDHSTAEAAHLFRETDANKVCTASLASFYPPFNLLTFVGDMWRESNDSEDQPDWVNNERDQFRDYRDKNKDGRMDSAEVKEWIIPTDYDHAESEAKHLMYESDENKDLSLTKEEILSNYDLFVGSQATDFGEALTKHDEF